MSSDFERAQFWEKTSREYESEANYYREQLTDAHTLLGRVIHQLSERWDSVNLSQYFPTDNLNRRRRVGNAAGEKESGHE